MQLLCLICSPLYNMISTTKFAFNSLQKEMHLTWKWLVSDTGVILPAVPFLVVLSIKRVRPHEFDHHFRQRQFSMMIWIVALSFLVTIGKSQDMSSQSLQPVPKARFIYPSYSWKYDRILEKTIAFSTLPIVFSTFKYSTCKLRIVF